MNKPLEPVEAVSTAPDEFAGWTQEAKDLVSAPLPQHISDGLNEGLPHGTHRQAPALPQQEEPARRYPSLLHAMTDPRDYCTHCKLRIYLDKDQKIYLHHGSNMAPCYGGLDTNAAPIAPLLGQDEPKICAGCGEEYSPIYYEYEHEGKLYCTETCAGQSIEAQLTQALTSLAAATEREKDLKSSFGITSERERTALAEAITRISKAIAPRMWLVDGRGCYEWDDDTYRKEFGWAMNEVLDAIDPLRKIAGDWTTCPMKAVELEEARMDWKQRAHLAEASLTEAQKERRISGY